MRKTELAAFKCEAVAATSGVTSTLPHRIRDGLLVTKGNPLFFLPKPFFFRYAAPRARSATHERSENKAKQGEFFVGGNPLIAY